MFEYENESYDHIPLAFYGGGVIFVLLWIVYRLPIFGFMFEAYTLTCVIFVAIPYEFRKQDMSKMWFWKTMLGAGIVIHLPLLAGLRALDNTYTVLLSGTLSVDLVMAISVVPEIVVFDKIVKRFRPTGVSNPQIRSWPLGNTGADGTFSIHRLQS